MHRKEVTHSNGSYERKSRGRKLADEMGRAKKFPWYTHRLMHQKRVTCELHDSYFRLMTIKHSISKIEWASNDYITQLSSTSQWSCRQLEWDVVGRATPGRGGPREPRWSLGTREVADKMQWWKPSPSSVGLRLSSPGERDKTLTAITLGSKYFSYVRCPAPSHMQTFSNPFQTLAGKVRGKNIVKEVFLRLSLSLRLNYCVVVMLETSI